jgi:DNA-directed RNA polymerase subunit RPC12/RpoP
MGRCKMKKLDGHEVDGMFPLDLEDTKSTPGLIFYRCMVCGKVVSVWDIHASHGCSKCGGTRIKPTNPTLFEKIVQIVKHPKIWTWGNI